MEHDGAVQAGGCHERPVDGCMRARPRSAHADRHRGRDRWYDACTAGRLCTAGAKHRASTRARGKDRRLIVMARIVGIHRRRGHGCTVRDPAADTADDLVNRRFVADGPDRLWLTDIAEHPTGTGKVYLAAVLDVFLPADRGLVDR
jgi:transposase InsO family protein